MSIQNPLAYARVIDKLYIPEQYDKRKKLTAKQKQEIRKLYRTTKISYNKLAKLYGVSYGTIQTTINEQTRKANLLIAQKYRNSGKFKRPPQTMELRRLKRELVIKGIIKLDNQLKTNSN
jgi:transposase